MNWLFALALLLAAAVAGYAFRADRNQAAITAAESRASLCESTTSDTQDKIADVQRQLTDLRKRHTAALAASTAALDTRDAEIAALTDAAKGRAANIRNLTHEDPVVAALARLPVPAALADQLWPDLTSGTRTAGAR